MTFNKTSAALLTFLPYCALAQSPSPKDFVSAVESYYYSSISMNKVAEIGCAKYVPGFPVGFSLTAIRTELIANTPNGALNKVNIFLSDTRYAQGIYAQLSWMDAYKAQKGAKEFGAMCADFGGKQLMGWQHYRKEFFRISAYFR